MKRILSFVFALFLSISVSAQTTLTEAVNFTSTAHNGEEIDLFEILDGGQYVLIDFFFSTCGPCKEYAPRIVDAYYKLGCNEGDVYFMEISPTDTYAPYSTDQWINTYNIPYPTIHTKTAGTTGDVIYETYNIAACPTLILIAPDRKILLQDYKPTSADDLVNKLIEVSENNIEENYCGQDPEVSIAKIKKDNFYITDGVGIIYEASTKVHVDFRANAAVKDFYYTISESANLTSEDIIANGTKAEGTEFSHTFEGLKELTTYFVYAQAIGYDDANGNKSVIETKTICPGDEGESEIQLEVMVTDSHVNATAKPNESTADYHFGFVKKEFYDESEENSYKFLISLINDDYPLCDRDTYVVETENIPGNVPYYVIAIGRNGEGEWGAPTVEEFVVEKEAGPAEVSLNVKAMPTEVTITATPNQYAIEFHYGLVSKLVYNGTGEAALVEQVRNDGHPAYAQESATWTELFPDTEYVALGSAKNANGEWGETTVVHFKTPKAQSLSEMEATFNIYPNPAKSMINIESSLNGKAQIKFFDMTGRCVKEVSATDMNNVSVNVEDLNEGVYFISIQQDNNYNIQKLVIE